MTTAVFAPALADNVSMPSRLSLLVRSVIDALAESRAREALRELRRHEAFLKDLGLRQDHSPLFLTQDEALPFKI
jgi:uncharacterized protein YjiS (DUF1127 family)